MTDTQTKPNQPTFIGTAKAAEMLLTTPRNVRYMLANGHFPLARKLNPHAPRSTWRIPIEEVKALCRKQLVHKKT